MRTIGLVGGLTPESTLEYYRRMIRSARERLRDPDGVILGCTELPLAISQDDLEVPVIDTVRVHVQAILDRALG